MLCNTMTTFTFGKWCHQSDDVLVLPSIVGAEEWILTWRRVTYTTELCPFCDGYLNPSHLIPDVAPQPLIMLNYWYQLTCIPVFRLVDFLKLLNKASRVRSMFSRFQIVIHYFLLVLLSAFFTQIAWRNGLISPFLNRWEKHFNYLNIIDLLCMPL